MIAYHDAEWGVPQHDDRVLFEFLILEGAQAGLSWSTILAKREAYRRAFSNFNPKSIARYDASKTKQLMANESIVRNRLKIAAAVQNARAFLNVQRNMAALIHISGDLWVARLSSIRSLRQDSCPREPMNRTR